MSELTLAQAEDRWNKAAKALVEKRQLYHVAHAEKIRAAEEHSRARQEYLRIKDLELGIEPADDDLE
jgi:hypothetical protein